MHRRMETVDGPSLSPWTLSYALQQFHSCYHLPPHREQKNVFGEWEQPEVEALRAPAEAEVLENAVLGLASSLEAFQWDFHAKRVFRLYHYPKSPFCSLFFQFLSSSL